MTPEWLRRLPIAHRGLHGGGAPENSLASFEAAIAAGTAIELDVRTAAGGEPMVFHDEHLERMTGRRGRLDQCDRSSLRTLRLAGSDERIPTLAQALDRVGGRTPVLVEIKPASRAFERRCARILAVHAGDTAVQSFDPVAVRHLGRLLPGMPCGLLAGTIGRLRPAAIAGADFLAFDVRSAALGAARRMAGRLAVPLIVWTVRTRREHAIADRLGLNRIFEADRDF